MRESGFTLYHEERWYHELVLVQSQGVLEARSVHVQHDHELDYQPLDYSLDGEVLSFSPQNP